MRSKKYFLSLLSAIILSSCNTEQKQNYPQTTEETSGSSESVNTPLDNDPIQTTAITTLSETAISTTIYNEFQFTTSDNKDSLISETEFLKSEREVLKIPETSDLEEKNIYDNFIKAYHLAFSGGTFKWKDNTDLIEMYTGSSLSEFINEYRNIFTKKHSNELLNLYGTEDEEYLNLQHTAKDIEEYRNNEFDKYIHFDDLTNVEQYKKYDFVQIGGTGDRGGDLSYNDHELRIISKTDNEIIIENTVWHYIPYSISSDSEDFPDYICHLENGQLIIDSKWNDRGKFMSADELTGTVKEVPVISAYDTGIERPNEYLEKFEYRVILEDGQWKFDNLELWW